MLLPRSEEFPRPDLGIRDPVLYHEIRSNFFLSPLPNFLRFSGGVSPETRCAANLIFRAFTTDIDVADLINLFIVS